MSAKKDAALAFVRHFCAGEVETLAPLLADDLRFRGPLLRCDSAADYLAALRAESMEPCGFLIHSITAEADAVAVFYDSRNPGGDLTVAQLFRYAGAKMTEMLLVFDAPKEPMP